MNKKLKYVIWMYVFGILGIILSLIWGFLEQYILGLTLVGVCVSGILLDRCD